MNALESVIAFLAPGVAARREFNRYRLDQFRKARGYEGNDRGRRTANWKTSSRDANAEIAPALIFLRNRSRDLRRNNPYAECAVSFIVDNLVGYGIKPKPKGRTKSQTKRASELWKVHAETRAIDRDGKHNVYGLQALAAAAAVEAGGAIVRRYLMTSAQQKAMGLPLPFQLQVLEADYIDLKKDGDQPDGSYDIKGIRFEQTGAVRGYWLYDKHPGSAGIHLSGVSKFVPARDVLYIFRTDRPGQVHGVPWSAPVILRLRNTDEMDDATMEAAKVAACFGVWITAQEPDAQKKKQELAERLEPGAIHVAPPGTSVQASSPPTFTGYKDYSSISLHAIAAGYGVPYEAFGDLAGVNFSSGRMGWQNFQRRLDRWQFQMFIPNFCDGVWSWFNSSLRFTGNASEDIPAEHVPPRRMMVNPKEEIAAKKDEIRNGLSTWPQAVTELGYDPDEQLEEIAEANAKLDAAGVKLDCDPRFALPAGSAGTDNANKDNAENKDVTNN